VGAELIVLGRHGRRPLRDLLIGSTAQRVIHVGDLPVLVVAGRAVRGYRRPLIAVTLEDTSRSVVAVALRALGPDVTPTLVNAYHVPFEGFVTPSASPGEMTELRKEYKRAALIGMTTLQRSLADFGISWETAVAAGEPGSVILREAARRRADLLVLGTHGRLGLSHALVGSVAEAVSQVATCDVLITRSARVPFELP
jgi:nucleotide-binding universal stress UspA family protein